MRVISTFIALAICTPLALSAQCNLSNYTSATILTASSYPYFSSSSGVTVSATTSNVPTLGNTSYSCGGNTFATATPAWWPNAASSVITLTFSLPVSSFTVVVNGTNTTELFTFTPNTGTVSLSNYCTTDWSVTGPGNQLLYSGSPASGTIITVNNPAGATQYVLNHNGVGSGSRLALLDCFVLATVLPAEMSVFDAAYVPQHRRTQLNWETINEVNTQGFEVQHSIDGQNWNVIGFVEGAGNSTGAKGYSFRHAEPPTGINMYKLRILDVNGNFSYSETKEVMVEPAHELFVFPNPSNGLFEVRAFDRNGSLSITDALGRNILEEPFEDFMMVDLSQQPKGVYFVVLEDENMGRSTRRVVLE